MAGKTDPVDDSFIKRSIQIRNEYPYILKAGEYSTWLSTNSQYGPFQDLIIDPDHIYVSLTVLASSKRGNFKLSLSYSETDLSVPVKEDKDAGVKESKNGISSFIKADYMPILQHTTKGSAYKVKRFLMSTYLLGAYDNSLNDISSKLVKHDLFYFSLDRFISSNGFSKFELLYDKSNLGYQTVTLNKIEVHVEESEPLFIVFIGKDEIKYIFSMETFARYFIRDILNYYPRILNTNSKYEYLNNFGIESDKKIIALFGVTQSGKSSLARAWLQGQSDPTLVTKNSLYKYVNGVNLPVYYQIGEPERGNKWTRGIRQGNLMDWIDIFENILIRKGDFFIIDSLRTFGTLSDANLTSGGISAELVNLLTIWNILLPRLIKPSCWLTILYQERQEFKKRL